tara:strand:- start:122 stop:643 length:522 start_codon:yes stop_codon:yes gene_type:complete
MATRLSQKTALADNLASGDLLMTVDVSDTTSSVDGTSKKIENKYIIQTDVLTGNLDLQSSPLTLVSAPGSGYFIQPITTSIIYKYNSVATSIGNYLYIGYIAGSTTVYLNRQRDIFKDDTADRSYSFGAPSATTADGVFAGDIENKPLILYNSVDLNGNGSFKVYVTYQIVKC